MPKLVARTDDLESIDAKYRDLYVEDESNPGTFVLDAEGVEDTAGLKNALKKEREAAALSKQFSKLFPDKTPAQIKALVDAAEKAGKKKGDDDEVDVNSPAVRKLLTAREQELLDEHKPVAEERDRLKSENKSLRIDAERRKFAEKAGIFADQIDDVLTLTSRRFDLDDAGKIVVLDADGNPTTQSVEKFFTKTFKEERPRYYQGSGNSGSSAEQGRRGAPTTQDPSKMSATDKIAAGLAARKER